ncbi:MAG: ATP-binding domain-containing protein [Betaproteobacteria bacterium]|nr:ATP-binding domain-containing protein [Betaproteobacteria bacterium]
MARVIPDGWETMQQTYAATDELETLALLARSLPDDYTVYHGIHWTRIQSEHAIYGEIDFVVVNRSGHLLLIEQKRGPLTETPEGLQKQYSDKTKSVVVQMSRSADGLRTKLVRYLNGPAAIEHLLYCPDHTVRNASTAGLEPERIVDARRREQFTDIIRKILPPGEDLPAAESVHCFLRDVIKLEPDVSALVGRARALVTRVSGGLAYWARRLDMQPHRLRVTGTAGSGKTQLALAEYRAAIDAGKRPLYVCFNRPLADHFAAIVPVGGLVCTFHMLCDRLVRSAGEVPVFSGPSAFPELVARAAALPLPPDFVFDTLIVDEGQDFQPEWRDIVLRHALPDARILWLEDPMQNLYDHPAVELPGWVGIRANVNYRSPHKVVRLLQMLLPAGMEIEAASPIDGSDVEFLTYADHAGLIQRVKDGIGKCYAAGFGKDEVALLSFRGREGSRLLGFNQLGTHTLRTFTGDYDGAGRPVYSDGDVVAESVYRFKGQSAPAVVLAEIDFEALDDKAVRKLFVGATRASMKLVLVLSEKAAGVLLGME